MPFQKTELDKRRTKHSVTVNHHKCIALEVETCKKETRARLWEALGIGHHHMCHFPNTQKADRMSALKPPA